MSHFAIKDLIYDNPLAAEKDIAEFILEGDAAISFPQGRMRMENRRDPSDGQAANFVHWLNRDFPSDIAIAWDFLPIREPGLCIVFFAANGRGGKDRVDPQFAERTGGTSTRCTCPTSAGGTPTSAPSRSATCGRATVSTWSPRARTRFHRSATQWVPTGSSS